MKILALSLLTFASQAFALDMTRAFDGVTDASSKCYVRDYSDRHLRANPRQTVKQIKIKLSQYKYDEQQPSQPILSIQVKRKGEKNVWNNSVSCQDWKSEDGSPTVFCAVECDGGSVEMTGFNSKGMLLLKNNGILLYGGCGADENGNEVEPIFLTSKPGGDDKFVIPNAGVNECADVKTGWQ